MYPPFSLPSRLEEVPMPPLNPLQIIPVPPPTFPSTTGPVTAESIARRASSFFTWNPLMSFSQPSQGSATTGSAHPLVVVAGCSSAPRHAITASPTPPTPPSLPLLTPPPTTPHPP